MRRADRRRSEPGVVGVALVMAAALGSLRAEAHELGLSKGEYRVEGQSVRAELVLARADLLEWMPGLDVNGDRALEEGEWEEARSRVGGAIDRVRVFADGERCQGALKEIRLIERDGATIAAEFACSHSPKDVQLSWDFGLVLGPGHRHLASLSAGKLKAQAVLFPGNPTLEAAVDATPPMGLWAMFRMGVEHILSGYDHLLFLLGLALARSSWRSLAKAVTAFTVAHALTLGALSLGVWAPSPRWVEPLIALSIAYVAVQNLVSPGSERRWMATFPFGLLHGFGFAGALQDISLSHDRLLWTLGAFNLGVEVAQLGVLAAAVSLLTWAWRFNSFRRRGVQWANALLALPGVLLFAARIGG